MSLLNKNFSSSNLKIKRKVVNYYTDKLFSPMKSKFFNKHGNSSADKNCSPYKSKGKSYTCSKNIIGNKNKLRSEYSGFVNKNNMLYINNNKRKKEDSNELFVDSFLKKYTQSNLINESKKPRMIRIIEKNEIIEEEILSEPWKYPLLFGNIDEF